MKTIRISTHAQFGGVFTLQAHCKKQPELKSKGFLFLITPNIDKQSPLIFIDNKPENQKCQYFVQV